MSRGLVITSTLLSFGLYLFLLTTQQQPTSYTAIQIPPSTSLPQANPSSSSSSMSQHLSQWEEGPNLHEDIVRIPDGSAPETTWLPLYNRRTPYNEEEIVNLITEISRNFVSLSDVEEADIVWPPEGGHNLDETLCDELNVSEAARSLIRRLPSSASIKLFESSQLFVITEDWGLRQSRVAPPSNKRPQYPAEGTVLPQDVQLAIGDRESSGIFLDTQENTIRVASMSEWPDAVNPPYTPLERSEDPPHYRNYWPRHAPTWLRVQLNKIKALDTIPPCWSHGAYVDFESEWLRRKIKHILEGTYGWPDDFQQATWDKDREQVWEDAEQEYENLGNPRVLKFV